jgi:hypothetical protein
MSLEHQFEASAQYRAVVLVRYQMEKRQHSVRIRRDKSAILPEPSDAGLLIYGLDGSCRVKYFAPRMLLRQIDYTDGITRFRGLVLFHHMQKLLRVEICRLALVNQSFASKRKVNSSLKNKDSITYSKAYTVVADDSICELPVSDLKMG